MNIWVNVLHNDERVFWRTMTPHRCAALYKRYFRMMQPRHAPKMEKKMDLMEYMMGGG